MEAAARLSPAPLADPDGGMLTQQWKPFADAPDPKALLDTQRRESIAAKLVANLITEAGANRVLACDLRSGQSMGYFDIPVDHVDGQPVILDYLASKTICLDDLVVVSLDVGGVARARAFVKKLSDTSLAIVDKRRLGHNVAEVMNLIGDVRGKVAVVVDDMIDTAGQYEQLQRAFLKGNKNMSCYFLSV
ncbi:ribose-phosphate pyrophosphokinase 1-like [Asparagus officinalis]|uniref:ribose-phosphate pyrophosphokinase 1-like n=1 Tax=Asparagus officinalis TaxID=4686 RepID=UPI00098E19BB|nr:ribose-phosphate pyrophosphokinase 1-like [Asparagus officinalis]